MSGAASQHRLCRSGRWWAALDATMPLVPVLRSTALVDAGLHTVAAAARGTEVLRAEAVHTNSRAQVPDRPGGLVGSGDEFAWAVRLAPGIRVRLRMTVRCARIDALELRMRAGPLHRLRRTTTLAATPAGTLVTDTVDWTTPGGGLGRVADVLLLRRPALQTLRCRTERIRQRAERLADPATPVVVGAAVLATGLLVQQRGYPSDCAGRWELPGGRVEPGETEHQALVRECREELGVEVLPGGRVGPDVSLPGGAVLRIHRARLADPSAEPRALHHRAVRWAGGDELAYLDWLAADRILIPDLQRALRAGS